MSPAQPRTNVASVNARVDDHEARIDLLEQREAKYDVILERLSTIAEFLTKRVEAVNTRVDEALEGQRVIEERNSSAHRWSAAGIALASSLIVGIVMFVVGYLIH